MVGKVSLGLRTKNEEVKEMLTSERGNELYRSLPKGITEELHGWSFSREEEYYQTPDEATAAFEQKTGVSPDIVVPCILVRFPNGEFLELSSSLGQGEEQCQKALSVAQETGIGALKFYRGIINLHKLSSCREEYKKEIEERLGEMADDFRVILQKYL